MKTLILDFDGTIADTHDSIVQTVQATLVSLNFPVVDENKVKQLIGLPLKDTFVKVAGINDEELLNKAVDCYRKMYDEVALHTVKLFPKVKDTLKYLYEKGVKITVASSKGKVALLALLDYLNIKEYVSVVFGEQDVSRKKPAPDMALHIMEQVESCPDETFVVGDTIYDIIMGNEAGCITCAVSYGNHTLAQLQTAQPDYIVDDFAGIINILNV